MSKHLEPPLPDKPSPQHTKLITCIEDGCKAKRWVKPQDFFQVKRCRTCQEERKGRKSKASFERMKVKVEVKKEEVRRYGYMPRLQVVKFHRWNGKKDWKPKRIWP